ncbi:DUF4040 family protein [Mobilicoccus massiliensis]|uniref:DUF4040 family protein n=1 Tax=Mobilicoccus massiliensis TaxID=1522310 RepID=UPI00058AC01F|nr:DUF4040 family protein [Mobilicoccus massiliensis]
MTPTESLPGTLLLLLIAVALAPLLSRVLGRNAGFALAALYLAAAAVFLPAVLAVLAGENPTWSTPWVPALGVELALRADGLGVVFALIALVIGAVVLTYSTRYLAAADEHGRRLEHRGFFLVMATFTAAMTGLVLTDDLVTLFVCWEITSIASFLLVGQGGRAGEAASLRTMFLTFVGGLTLLVAIGLVVARTGTTAVGGALADPVWATDPAFTSGVALLVLLAGFTKSAQFPFHVWLPDAMAASTPVSAYLHAAAVVKAGIFLLLRFSPAFHATPLWNATLICTGLFTAALGALFALQQTDLKRLMAYSTVSQLGLVVAAIGVGTPLALAAAVAHVIAHALFKSGLFMMVGVVDHATGTRDLRRLPPLWRSMPVSFAVACVGAASMAGIPPLLGFVTKESLFTALHDAPGGEAAGWAALAAGAAASILTFAYCGKIVLGGFVDGSRRIDDGRLENGEHLHTPGLVLLGAAALPILAGIPLGLAAGVLDHPVDLATQAARPGSEHHSHFVLWHGLTPELLATLVVFALGLLALASRHRLWPLLERPLLPVDGAGVIALLNGALRRAGLVASQLVSGHHPTRHLATILGAFAAVLLGGLLTLTPEDVPPSVPHLSRPLDLVLFVLIAGAVSLVVRVRARLAAVVSLSAVGILVTVQIVSLGAPDVALTQLLVEALTIVVIMLVLQKLPVTFLPTRPRPRVLKGAIAVAAGLAAGLGTWLFTGRRGRSEIAEYYLTHTEEVSGGHNIVNVILVEFRALDTLGELSVLGMTGVALVAVLSTVRDRQLDPYPVADPHALSAPQPGDDSYEDSPPHDTRHVPRQVPRLRGPGTTARRAILLAWPNTIALQLMLRIVVPLLVLVSAGLFWRGHNAPGGGFIAALVGSAIVGLVYLSTARDRQIGPPRLPIVLIGGGIVVAVGTGLVNLVVEGAFLQPGHTEIAGIHLTTSMVFDAGVYAAVLGLVMAAFNLLGTGEATETERTHERAREMTEGEILGESDIADLRRRRRVLRPRGSHEVRTDDDLAVLGLDEESKARAHTRFLASGTAPAQAGHAPRTSARSDDRSAHAPTTEPEVRP